MDLTDLVMAASIEQYNKLSKAGKPKQNEWTVMSAIVGDFSECGKTRLKVLSLGTGSKCIGRSFMSPNGDILNDSHSEVVARRGFLRYLYTELIRLNETDFSEVFCRANGSSYRVRVKRTVKFYFVTSMSPCGDASIIPKTDDEAKPSWDLKSGIEENFGKIIAKDDDKEEPLSKRMKIDTKDIHRTGAKCLPSSEIQDLLLPGVDYHRTGAVRTKPGRGDPTASVSCSDKLARWNSVGIQGALLSIFIEEPIFIQMIIIGGGCPYSHESCNRAINLRTGPANSVSINQSSLTFPDTKSDKRIYPCPNSIIWFKGEDKEAEVSVNGRKQGTTKKNIHKASARTSLCKKELLISFEKSVNSLKNKQEIMEMVLKDTEATCLKSISYFQLKSKAIDYRKNWERVKNSNLKVWTDKPDNLLNFTLNED